MRTLKYRLGRDRFDKPLVTLESEIGNGREIYPEALRKLAAALIRAADEAEQMPAGRKYREMRKEVEL